MAAMCDPAAQCVVEDMQAVCTCPEGYEDANMDGTVCDEVDECAEDLDDCTASELCSNNDGGFDCTLTTSCADLLAAKPELLAVDGLYMIDVDGEGGEEALEVECDMSTDGGGWTKALGWDRENEGETLMDFTALMTEDVNDMNGFSEEVDHIRWEDLDLSFDAMAYHADVGVPNGGEVLFPFHYYGHSMEASGVWFFAEAGGAQTNIRCWDDTDGVGDYDAMTDLIWVPADFVCPNDNQSTSWTWDEIVQSDLGGEVTRFEIRSLQADINGGDYSRLFRFELWVR